MFFQYKGSGPRRGPGVPNNTPKPKAMKFHVIRDEQGQFAHMTEQDALRAIRALGEGWRMPTFDDCNAPSAAADIRALLKPGEETHFFAIQEREGFHPMFGKLLINRLTFDRTNTGWRFPHERACIVACAA
jgi:hypothetical protein